MVSISSKSLCITLQIYSEIKQHTKHILKQGNYLYKSDICGYREDLYKIYSYFFKCKIQWCFIT